MYRTTRNHSVNLKLQTNSFLISYMSCLLHCG